jgi:hypothetical protein
MNRITEPGGRHARPVTIACLVFLGVYFAVSAHKGLGAYFTQDDGGNLMHMHKYWEHSLASVFGSAVRVVTGTYRPLGGIYYFVLYRVFGFNPLPFRVVCLALMLANVFLAFALLRRLSGSLEAALLGAVALVHHPAVLDLLYSSGTIYEILCFLFYFLAVLCYLAWRQAGQEAGRTSLTWPQLAGLLALTGCALDSKEMAMTLPGALLLVELVYFPPESHSWREAARFVWRQGRATLTVAALVVPTIAVKVLTHNPLSGDPSYSSHSLRAAVENACAFQNFLLYGGLHGRRVGGVVGRDGGSGDRLAFPSDEVRPGLADRKSGPRMSHRPAGRLYDVHTFDGMGSLRRVPVLPAPRRPGSAGARSLGHRGAVCGARSSCNSRHAPALRHAQGLFRAGAERAKRDAPLHRVLA